MMKENAHKMLQKLAIATVIGASLVSYGLAVSFSDSKNHWGEEFISDASSGGFVTGYTDGTYKPDENVTGNEFAVMLTTAFLGEALFIETEKDYKNWADPYVETIIALGNDSHFFRPFVDEIDFEEPLTRFSAAYMVAAILEAQKVESHSEKQVLEVISQVEDLEKVQDAQQVGVVMYYGFMEGMPDGNFHGIDTLTRAEAAVILSNMTNSNLLQVDSFENYPKVEETPTEVVVETVVVEKNNITVVMSLTVTLFAAIAYGFWLRNSYIKEIDDLKQNLAVVQDRFFQQKTKMGILSEELALSEKRNREFQEQIEQIRILLSHELQMPTSVIRGYSDLLLDDLEEEKFEVKAKKDYLQKIIARANYISKALYAQLALLTRQTYQLTCIPLDLVSVAQQVAEDTAQSAHARGITLQVLPWDSSENVLADEDLVRNVLYNLIENSIKYMGREGLITLRLERKEDCVHLCVRDDGLGLDATETSHIFELNYQGSNRIPGKGFGHGLHMVQQTILKMNGRIWAESQPGQGMAITLALPLAQKPVISLEKKELVKTQ